MSELINCAFNRFHDKKVNYQIIQFYFSINDVLTII